MPNQVLNHENSQCNRDTKTLVSLFTTLCYIRAGEECKIHFCIPKPYKDDALFCNTHNQIKFKKYVKCTCIASHVMIVTCNDCNI